MKPKQEDPKEMVGGCCVCSDENGWTENPLVYCDGQGCNVAVHQACYGIVTVPTGSWFCRKCESQERAARVQNSGGGRVFPQRCELCPSKDGALKRTDSGGWAHVVCALYIPEVRFGNVTTMEPIMLQLIPPERFNKSCCICEENGKERHATVGACMQCNKSGCKQHFHVTCAQSMGLLCEEAGNYLDNVKYCGYCQYHFSKLLPTFQKKGSHVKTVPPYRPAPPDAISSDDDGNNQESKDPNKLKRRLQRPMLGPGPGPATAPGTSSNVQKPPSEKLPNNSGHEAQSLAAESGPPISTSASVVTSRADVIKLDSGTGRLTTGSMSSGMAKASGSTTSVGSTLVTASSTFQSTTGSASASTPVSSASTGAVSQTTTSLSTSVVSSSAATASSLSSSGHVATSATTSIGQTKNTETTATISAVSSENSFPRHNTSSHTTVSTLETEKERQKKLRRTGLRTPSGNSSYGDTESILSTEDLPSNDLVLNICEEKNLTAADKEADKHAPKGADSDDGLKLNVQFTPNVSSQPPKLSGSFSPNSDSTEPMKRGRSNSQDRGRRPKRSSTTATATLPKRGKPATTKVESSTSGGRDSGASSPDSFASDGGAPPAKRGRRKPETKENTSVITNGIGPTALLLGNQINPASAVAQKMTDTLHAELEAHSIYKDEEKLNNNLVGPALPIKKENASSSPSNGTATQPPPFPQSLEQLLERQWEQGSQFLMEQAQHFDIASLLSCLYQLRQENVRLEEAVTTLASRRDHLLAVNARLSVPLFAQQGTATTTAPSSASSTPSLTSVVNQPSAIVPLSQSASAISNNTGSHLLSNHPSNSQIGSHTTVSSVAPLPNRTLTQGRHPSGGHPSSGVAVSNREPLHRGGTSPHERERERERDRRPQAVSGAASIPVENGLAEPDYRYRSPSSSSDPHNRQQSPAMLPPGAQPSPTLRHSPAGGGVYHSSASPHGSSPHGVSSHSPSSVGHVVATHGPPQHPIPHGTSIGRGELVRITGPPPHSHAGPGPNVGPAGYPVYQMVSPPVPGPHHSPVSINQHPPSHSQVMRREIEPSRGAPGSLEKR